MPRYATKSYVRHEMKKAEESPVYRVAFDFDGDTVNGLNGDVYQLYDPIVSHISSHDLWTDIDVDPDDQQIYRCRFRICYIRVHLRTATGESETSSAVSQTVRVVIYRTNSTYNTTPDYAVGDVDAMPRYNKLYGDINGLWYDKTKYIHSWAADGDTTAGGQVFFKAVLKPLHSEVFTWDGPSTTVASEKGQIALQIVGDDPTGTNSQTYGFIEIGFKLLDN